MCPRCTQFRGDPKVGTSKQLKLIDNHPKHKGNRMRINSHFLATLLEAVSDDSDSEQLEKDKDLFDPSNLCPSVQPLSTSSRFADLPRSKSPDPSISSEIDAPSPSIIPVQTGKLQQVLADLKIASLIISELLRRRLISVVCSKFDAFAALPTDLGHTSVVVLTIKTGDAKPFRHKLRAVPFARRQYLE